MNKTQMAARIAELEGQLSVKQTTDIAGLFPATVTADTSVVQVLSKEEVQGLNLKELVGKALSEKKFITYGQVGTASGIVNGKFLPSHNGDIGKILSMPEFPDYIVVNTAGKYGRSAPVTEHHAKLTNLGYTAMPALKAKKAPRKAKAGKQLDTAMVAQVTAAVIAAIS